MFVSRRVLALLVLGLVADARALEIRPDQSTFVRLNGSTLPEIVCEDDRPVAWYKVEKEVYHFFQTEKRLVLNTNVTMHTVLPANESNVCEFICVSSRTSTSGNFNKSIALLERKHYNTSRTIIVTQFPYSFTEGSEINMTCSVSNNGAPELQPILPRTANAIDISKYEFAQNGLLTVKRAELKDTGIYNCPIRKYYIHVYDSSIYPNFSSNSTDNESGEVRVYFTKKSNPQLASDIKWSMNGCELNREHHEQFSEMINFYEWVTIVRINATICPFVGPGDNITVAMVTDPGSSRTIWEHTLSGTRSDDDDDVVLKALQTFVATQNGSDVSVVCQLSGIGDNSYDISWSWQECQPQVANDTQAWNVTQWNCRPQPNVSLKVCTHRPNATVLVSTVTWRPLWRGYMRCNASHGHMSAVSRPMTQKTEVILMTTTPPPPEADQAVPVAPVANLTLVCLVDRYQYAGDEQDGSNVTVRWLHNGQTVRETADGTVRIWQKRSDEFTDAHVLQMPSVTADMEGTYECLLVVSQIVTKVLYRWEIAEIAQQQWQWVAVGAVLFAVMVVLIGVGLFFYGQHKGLQRAGITDFVQGDLPTYISRGSPKELAHLLPYKCSVEFPLQRLRMTDCKLGSGAFGVVHRAQALNIVPGIAESTVAVKMAKSGDDDTAIRSLIAELKIMTQIGQHENVLQLLGAVTQAIRRRKLYVIIEFCGLGNLQEFLRAHQMDFVDHLNEAADRIETDGRPAKADAAKSLLIDQTTVTTNDLLTWARHSAAGMAHLVASNVLHGDLAARNCLLTDGRVLKIADFGMSRALRSDESYHKTSDDPLPIKWMAIEAIRDCCYNQATDVWSFGVLLWELFSLAEPPYAGLPNRHVLGRLLLGHRMPRPPYATLALHRLMTDCWQREPEARPDFEAIVQRLGEMSAAAKTMRPESLKCDAVVVGTTEPQQMSCHVRSTTETVYQRKPAQKPGDWTYIPYYEIIKKADVAQIPEITHPHNSGDAYA